jgi:hypothetical protein
MVFIGEIRALQSTRLLKMLLKGVSGQLEATVVGDTGHTFREVRFGLNGFPTTV